MALVLTGCGATADQTTTTAPAPVAPPQGSHTKAISVDDADLTVWVADSAEVRSRGLMGVERLPNDVDGMLFVFESASPRSFHMLDTRLALDIWWFDADGHLIGSDEMEPCSEEPCPSHSSPDEVAWALETPLGDFDFPVGAVLSTG
jgi:hypothetical protein